MKFLDQSINRESFTNDSQIAGTLAAPALQAYTADPEDIGTSASDGNVAEFAKGNHRHRITFSTINSVLSGQTLTSTVFNGTFGSSARSDISGSFNSLSQSLASRIAAEEAETGGVASVAAGSGLTGGGTGAITIDIGAGTGIDVGTNSISVDVSDFMTNGSNNRVLTATGTDAMNAEANLTFDGTTLAGASTTTGSFGRVNVEGIGMTGTLFLAGGGASRILFNNLRSIEASTDGSALHLGEDFTSIRMRADIRPESNNSHDLGTSSFYWKNLYLNGNIIINGTVDGRDVATDGSKLDGIESGATADQTASEILTLLKTVDGAGSGLDADKLDGISSANFLRSNTSDTFSGTLTMSGDIIPNADGTRDLGADGTRWQNIYTSDLDLSNESKGGNSVDGSWGSYLIEEGENDLFLKNRRTGKTYKFMLQEV